MLEPLIELADLVDNSVDAGATDILIRFVRRGDRFIAPARRRRERHEMRSSQRRHDDRRGRKYGLDDLGRTAEQQFPFFPTPSLNYPYSLCRSRRMLKRMINVASDQNTKFTSAAIQ